ncbi:PEP-CTERM sorting domain-containing protein [Chroococcidiopsis sp. CCMEE 29]|uniref:PEP-CTERM sorting domain-containing protein n=1 Tax=Chroococcidiopsis sp. CCMEE 29 TaxID=155894 RepID=UPI0020215BF7|nr:PEP-CTERM sorting domain-containing protein [Chroococcidiopsis sp. CCMEE 29]
MQKFLTTAAGSSIISFATIGPAAAAGFYSITELTFNPSDINDQGQIVGENFFWNNGSLTDLSTLSGANGSPLFATAINNNGLIVGGGLTVDNSDYGQAFKSDGTTITALPRLPYCATSTNLCLPTTAEDINDTGTVALLVDNRSAYVQQPDGTTALAFSFGNPGVDVAAINNNNKVIGSTPATGRSGPGTGVLSDDGNLTRLIGPGYCSPFSGPCFSASTTATDINDRAQVVGTGPISPPASTAPVHALLWNDPQTNNVGTDLGALGGNTSRATGINNALQVVGSSDTAIGTQRAFLWEGEMIDLNNLIAADAGWEITSAVKINNQGQIVGAGSLNGQERGFVLTPVPEPGSILGILGFGAFGLGSWLKRKQQQKKVSEN